MAKDNVNIITGTSVFDGALIRGNTGFDGVSESNSLVVNDRIMAFRRKLHASENQIGNFTWRTSGNNFILSKGGKNFTISREGYAMQPVAYVAAITPLYDNLEPLQNFFDRREIITTSLDRSPKGVFYLSEFNLRIQVNPISYSENVITVNDAYGNYFMVSAALGGTVGFYMTEDVAMDAVPSYNFTIAIKDGGANLIVLGTCIIDKSTNAIWGAMQLRYISNSRNRYVFEGSLPSGNVPLIRHDIDLTTFNPPLTVLYWSSAYVRYNIDSHGFLMDGYFNSQYLSTDKMFLSVGKYVNTDFLVSTHNKEYHFFLMDAFDGYYSVKYNDDIYLNYANYAPISISHNGHKLLDLSGNQNEVGTHKGYLCAYVEGQWYRFYKTTYSSPQCTALANMLYMFNTTTVKNALFVNGSNITQYDGCCSEMRASNVFTTFSTYTGVYAGVFGSRANPLWQNGQIQGTSDEFSLRSRLALICNPASNQTAVCVTQDELYSIWDDLPPIYAYYPSSSSAPTTPVGVRVRYTDFSFHLDNNDTISVPAVSNPPEIVPAIFGVTYSDEATKIYIRVSGSLYPLLFTTLGTPAFVYRLLTEEAIAGGDYTFVIQGGLYTFSGQTQRISSNNKWVCDARGMVFCGHSTRCAYFYCIWDRGLYGFFGDNELKKLISMERFPLPVSSNKVGNFVNIPSIGVLMYSSPMGVVVVYNDLEQYCIIPVITDTIKENVINGYITIGDYDYYLSDTTVPRQPIELTTQWYGSVDDFTFTEFTGIIIICTNQNDGQPDLTVEIGTRDDSGEKWETIETKINFTSSGLGWCKIIPKQPRAIGLKLHIISQSDIMGIRVLTQPVDIQRGASK